MTSRPGSQRSVAFAVAAHPDDIEFLMAGTLLLLNRARFELHTMTVANGSCGSVTLGPAEIARVRTAEARRAAEVLGAVYHEPLVDDIQIHYTPEMVARLAAIVREVRPTILLVPSPQDYMEDHMNVSRLAVTAAFCRGMPNFATDPSRPAVDQPVALYHAMPAGLCDQFGQPVRPDICVDVSAVFDRKREALACHRSQKEFLDRTQAVGSYLDTMEDLSRRVGAMSGRFALAEGWRRHFHLGFAARGYDPLCEALGDNIVAPPTTS